MLAVTSVKENAEKYMEILEDKLHSCGSQLLQRVWEADLEACQLLIQGFQLKETSCCVFEEEENLMQEMEMTADDPPDSEKRKEGHFLKSAEWGTVSCHRHSELKKGMEDISFGTEGHLSEEFFIFSAELGEKCEAISEKLVHLEDQLQSSTCRVDEGVIHILFAIAIDMYQSIIPFLCYFNYSFYSHIVKVFSEFRRSLDYLPNKIVFILMCA
ncbi:disrupted in schizophrenia 1 protein-like [Pitangus sulphuratus]|nr:disrupted in schizophrenia 1 protein-like [Pitangus sulphuratus]